MTSKIIHQQGQNTLSSLVSPDGSLISRRLFADHTLYRRELDSIFQKSWIYLGHDSQLPSPGDFIQAWIGETPLIVARGEDQAIHVSVNSCTHRGVPVCRADQGNAKRFVCPYHNWSYTVKGELVAVPQEKKVCTKIDKSRLGLKKVPRVSLYRGMIFGCMDEEVIALDDYLGDMRWYLDCLFDRYEGGVEVIGAPHKWLLHANWKMPVENQLGDVGHGPYLHGSLLKDTPAVAELEEFGHNIVPLRGHGVSVRLMPEGTPPEKCMWGTDGLAAMDPEVHAYLLQQQHKVAERLGALRARIRPLCYSLYPNFSMLWPNGTLRISHPRGANKT
ncbi:MAG: Rieske 2Fe-2S domain-containing protein, partial [Pseudomonadales bacterium]|nr:Rieske 2Fe-2S domain-containing protein [Pseudomonadales bacterium]